MKHKEKIRNLENHKLLRRRLRTNSTNAEVKLWKEIRKLQVGGFKFRRQYGIGKYILDFYCPIKRLAIEIDGGQHFEEKKSYDIERNEFLEQQGIKVLRFWNNEVFKNTEGVLFKIREELGLRN